MNDGVDKLADVLDEIIAEANPARDAARLRIQEYYARALPHAPQGCGETPVVMPPADEQATLSERTRRYFDLWSADPSRPVFAGLQTSRVSTRRSYDIFYGVDHAAGPEASAERAVTITDTGAVVPYRCTPGRITLSPPNQVSPDQVIARSEARRSRVAAMLRHHVSPSLRRPVPSLPKNKPTKMKKQKSPDTLPYTFGFELTALPKNYTEYRTFSGALDTTQGTDDEIDRVCEIINSKLRVKYPRMRGASQDVHCLELPSPVFTSAKKALEFYRDAWVELRRLRCRPKHPVTVCGGNHLHFGVGDVPAIAQILRHLAHCYFIPWVFTQPDDTDSCDNASTYPCLRKSEEARTAEQNWLHAVYTAVQELPPTPDGLGLPGAKELAGTINRVSHVSGPTMEFRCVEAPKNEKEFYWQIRFFSAFVRYSLKHRAAAVKFQSRPELNKIPMRRAHKEFKALLKKLKLPYAPYAKLVRRNLFTRWHLNRVRH